MLSIYNINLFWNESNGDIDYEDYEQLFQLDVRRNVVVIDRGECYYGEVERFKQGQGFFCVGFLDVLDVIYFVLI